MRLQFKTRTIQLKNKRIHGGRIAGFRSSPMDSKKIHDLTKMMNKLYDKEQPNFAKKLTGRKFMI